MMQDETSLASFSLPRRASPDLRAAVTRAASGVPPTSATHAAPSAFRRALYGAPAVAVADIVDVAATPLPPQRRPDEEVFHIKLAESDSHAHAAALLIRKMYSWRGYAVDHDGATAITLFAECAGVVVGTMGLCLDGVAGLPADVHFRPQLDLLRDQGLRLCEPSRLAIDAGMSKRVFASMIHVAYLYAHVLHGYSDYIIEVNPRHVAFYQRMLGFERAGPLLACSRVGAPAVLLRLPLHTMGEQIRACGGRADLQSDERSFYPFFFAPGDEAAICERLLARRGRG